MALDSELLAKDIEAAMAANGFEPLANKAAGHDWWLAFAEGIVNHITTNAQVAVTSGSSAGTYKVT
ncbi:hypothetical protein [Marinomonas transparens]|uniref:Uncharacterized protein n=1 Tax=Marinomonas transparens TaxID=2795388 RepID=A0A934JQQ4_9GAMM|nr:hypothetical protein [Marinomonas transparens]MBJ7536642.1 hypothetical protein [Marinomonas transparens]